MLQRLVSLSALSIAIFAATPASAQIIIGGKPVTDAPGVPVEQPQATQAAALAATFPADPDRADYTPLSVATPAFSGATEAEIDVAKKIAELVAQDLASLGLFTAPDAAATSAFRADIGALPVWADWRGANVNALLLGKAVIGPENSLTVQFRLYDVGAGKQAIGTQYVLPSADQWRRTAHKIADDVKVALVGGKPGFDTRIAFASDASGKTRLGIVDADGSNVEFPIESIPGLQSPRYSPTTQTIVYSADAPVPGKPNQAQRTTITYDLATGRRDPVISGAQPNADVRYSADGRAMIFSRKTGANTDIHLLELSSRKETRLTDDKASDVEPTLSPDGTRFAFVSERAGASHVFVARVDGAPLACADGSQAKACQLTKEGGGYSDPAWSPSGDWIAYSRRVKDQAAISIAKADGSETRALTRPGGDTLDLSPSWAPDGRRLAFARVTGNTSTLAIVDLKGGEPQRISTPGSAYEPDWSPKRP